MTKKLFLALTLILYFNFSTALTHAKNRGKIYQFDLFEFGFSQLSLGFDEISQALSSALKKKFGQATFKEKVKVNVPGGICIRSGGVKYELFWYDSETEGFEFAIEQTDKGSSCPSGAYQELYPDLINQHLGELSYPHDNFLPLSRHYPKIQIGLTPSTTILQHFGQPTSKTKDELIYVLRRDLKKEKACGSAQEIFVKFKFKDKKLNRIQMVNYINGEC